MKPWRSMEPFLLNNESHYENPSSTGFGILLDIDGVLFRGRKLLPRVKDAFSKIIDSNGNFVVPTVFLTNGTNSTQKEKAEKLGETLGFKIKEECMVMAYAPLADFKELHKKQVLVIGQQHAKDIAHSVGFKNVTTIEQLGNHFPHLDCTDFRRKTVQPEEIETIKKGFKNIEAVVMLGEPVKWEMSLQLLLDCLLTHGCMDMAVRASNNARKPHIPIVACNVDLVWMSDVVSPLPRIGHGVFIHILETLYEKLADRKLHFHAVLGKPTEVTYLHATHIIQKQAREMGMGEVNTLYAVGDNPMSDVLGASLFNRYLRRGGLGRFDNQIISTHESEPVRNVVKSCVSMLVETGVYKEGCSINGVVRHINSLFSNMSVIEQALLRRPNFVEHDLYDAIETILSRERFRHPLK